MHIVFRRMVVISCIRSLCRATAKENRGHAMARDAIYSTSSFSIYGLHTVFPGGFLSCPAVLISCYIIHPGPAGCSTYGSWILMDIWQRSGEYVREWHLTVQAAVLCGMNGTSCSKIRQVQLQLRLLIVLRHAQHLSINPGAADVQPAHAAGTTQRTFLVPLAKF